MSKKENPGDMTATLHGVDPKRTISRYMSSIARGRPPKVDPEELQKAVAEWDRTHTSRYGMQTALALQFECGKDTIRRTLEALD